MTTTDRGSRLSRRDLIAGTTAGAAALAAGVGFVPGGIADATAQETTPARKQGGTAIVPSGASTPHLIPSLNAFSTYINPTVPFYSGVTTPGPDFQPAPDLAESWTVSEDGTVFTFTFRPNVTWHDGQPFSANDVKFTWELISHPLNVTAVQLYDFFSNLVGAEEFHTGAAPEITGVKVIDELTLEATLKGPWAPFLTIGTAQYILPRHILGDVPVDKIVEHEFARHPIGTGPFVFESWEADNFIVSNAFESYWRGRPALDQFIQRAVTPDNNTVVPALESNEYNSAALSLQVIDTLPESPSITVRQRPGAANQYIEFNLARPLFQDVRVRKALSFALNRQAIVDAIWQGRASIYNSVFPFDWWATKQDTTIFDNDPEQAKALLDEAGWLVGDDGIREKEGVKFSFLFQANIETWPLVVQQQWKDIGIETEFEYITFQTFSEQFYLVGDFDVYGMNVPYTLYADPHYALPGYFLSTNNRNQYVNPRSDELIIAAASTYDIEERKAHYYEWQEVIAQDIPHLWIANPDVAYGYSPGLITPERSGSYWETRELYDWFWADE